MGLSFISVRKLSRRGFVFRTCALALGILALAGLARASVWIEESGSAPADRRGVFAELLAAPEIPSESAIWLDPDEFASLDRLSPSGSVEPSEELSQGFEERVELPKAEGYFTGDSFGASQDVVVRGSVNLPSIKAIQFWGNGYFGKGKVEPKAWNGRIKDENSGAAAGINLPVGVGTFSAYYNYHRNRSNFSERKILQESGVIGSSFYANLGGFYFAALGTYGDDDYSARDATGARSAIRVGGYQTTAFFETGYEMATLGMFVLKPFGSYQYTNLKHGNFDPETLLQGPGKRGYNTCLMTLGSRVDLNLAGLDVFTLEGRMAWVKELRKKSESFRIFNYGRVPGTVSAAQPFFQGQGAGSDYFWGGLGLRLSLMGALAVSADYDCIVNKYQTLNEGSLSLLFGF